MFIGKRIVQEELLVRMMQNYKIVMIIVYTRNLIRNWYVHGSHTFISENKLWVKRLLNSHQQG